MQVAENGSKVKVHYVGSFTDGNVFDSNIDGEPLEFTLGDKMMIEGFERAVLGMKVGEKKQVSLNPEQAYGVYDEAKVATVQIGDLPPQLELEIGMMLQIANEDGSNPQVVTVKNLTETMVVLDGNHDLAGKELIFDIELVEII